jgi:hypothetical protein
MENSVQVNKLYFFKFPQHCRTYTLSSLFFIVPLDTSIIAVPKFIWTIGYNCTFSDN